MKIVSFYKHSIQKIKIYLHSIVPYSEYLLVSCASIYCWDMWLFIKQYFVNFKGKSNVKTAKEWKTPEWLFEPEKQLQQESMVLFGFWWFKVPLLKQIYKITNYHGILAEKTLEVKLLKQLKPVWSTWTTFLIYSNYDVVAIHIEIQE